MNRKILATISLAVVLGNVVIDRITKILASLYLKGEGVSSFFHDFIRLSYIENTGAFLSMGDNWPIFIKVIIFIILPLGFCLYGIYYCVFKAVDTGKVILLSTIIGGGLGNLIDRICNNFSVVDFLNFGISVLRTGILNVADLSITFGAVILIMYELSNRKIKTPQTGEE